MAITLDQCKKDMVLCAVDFFDKWGYWPTKDELFVMVKAIPEWKKLTKQIFAYDLRHLVDDWELLAACGNKIAATHNAKQRLTISEESE